VSGDVVIVEMGVLKKPQTAKDWNRIIS